MDDAELFYAALRRASDHGESREVAALRRYVHAEMLAGRIDGATTDRLGQLIDELSAKGRSQIGDVIGSNATDIPWDVLEFRDCEGDVWRRAFGEEAMYEGRVYDWVTEGGWSTTDGRLGYTPLHVTRVAQRPGGDD